MNTVCNPETGECGVSYETPSEEMAVLEEKVVAVLGCMLVLLNRGREDVLSGRSTYMNSFKLTDVNILEGKLPPLAIFRGEMKRCCESLQVALTKYLSPSDTRSIDVWRRLQRLKNVCYDAGFSRSDGSPCPTIFANWCPVYFSISKEDSVMENSEVAFWRGGQVTDEGLVWLLEKGFKTIVDLREENVKDEYYQPAIEEAVSCGKIEVVNLPVEAGTAPSMDQVQHFASLVSDSNRRPIYLHSQEGVNRTSAMVSRWRQFITRSLKQSVPNRPLNLNGKPFNDGKNEDLENKNESLSVLDTANHYAGTSSEVVGSDVRMELPNRNLSNGLASLQNTAAVHGTETAASESFIANNPLKAQFPKCDVFSRKEMAQFLKSREISPKTYLKCQKTRIDRLLISGETNELKAERNAILQESQSSGLTDLGSRSPADNKYIVRSNALSIINGKLVSNGSSASFGLNGNGMDGQERYGGNNFSQNNLAAAVKENTRNAVINSEGCSLDLVEGNMCASATGVVRVQSRKKAEMFLVRTDGYTCTREKVTESSLAFTHPSTQQQMLMWKSPPKTVLLLKKLGKELMEEAKEVASFLYHQERMNVLVEPDVHDIFARIPGYGFIQTFYSQDTSDLHERVDLVACLGGDGVILHASNIFRGAVPPVVSFNLGSLGFLTSHTFEDYRQDLTAVIHGNKTLDGVYITLRMRLRCEIFRNGKAMPGKVFDVLNEIVVDRGSNPYLSKIECYEHNRLITKVQGDGVIVATPTGSTAYSTAAGGSMVHPNVPCMLFTPICPHSLSFRPVILPDSAQLELKIPEDTRSNAWVSFDGKRRQQLSRGDSVRICMSEHPLPTVNKSDQTGDWFRSLIRCLNWNERLDQKAL
ncbi:probable NAD kinase 2, chloroplastic [Ananas comosus]|uniref:NAD(+) kinase n=1 Tax=Ananas comosus TaxID=4615 RepID=A0A6P5GE14_ANACO|nr:probable NAD kinase 2, chloroplastic [Ananas comosus]XP_020106862.1 probable NAD kinase 2, chloroplastic [Ananas comosus]